MNWLALDVGGANLKVADGAGFARSMPFALWRSPEQLASALRLLIAEAPPANGLAATMTGELADCFETKAAGVQAIIAALEHVADGRPLWIYGTHGELVDAAAARSSPELVAAANWHALASFTARFFQGQPGLLLDIGSTTTDIIPIVDGQPATIGRTDTSRLASGELVYTGVKRSPVCAVARAVPYRGGRCPLAQELFATAWDVYLVLGKLPEEPDSRHTADGRPATRAAAMRRLARSICADTREFDERDALLAAQAIAAEQAALIEHALRRVVDRSPSEPQTFIISGEGEFLAREVIERCYPQARVIALSEQLGPRLSQAAPAHALAVVADERWEGAAPAEPRTTIGAIVGPARPKSRPPGCA